MSQSNNSSENSADYNICYECSESLGNKGMSCPQCKESYHIKCHVPPKYVTISAYYQKQGLKNWKCSLCKYLNNYLYLYIYFILLIKTI